MPARVIPQPATDPNGRPWRELFRYADGAWLPADGTPDVAFGGNADGWPYAVAHVGVASRAVKNEAMEFVVGRYSCANGRSVDADGRYV